AEHQSGRAAACDAAVGGKAFRREGGHSDSGEVGVAFMIIVIIIYGEFLSPGRSGRSLQQPTPGKRIVLLQQGAA
ncbi:MAG TPA: hypothetical protein DEA88_03605, partial [Erwinia persicina]|nr:hypothetical protein [Erwinia persicina]